MFVQNELKNADQLTVGDIFKMGDEFAQIVKPPRGGAKAVFVYYAPVEEVAPPNHVTRLNRSHRVMTYTWQ